MKNQVLLIPHISLLKFPESESNSWEAWITEANEKSAKEAEMLKNCGYEIVKYETHLAVQPTGDIVFSIVWWIKDGLNEQ